jgi:hypothetical protein
MDSARIAGKLRAQILNFSGELSRGVPKVVHRFICEMIYGVQARQSVRLTEVSRALAEPISIKKTVERLSRQLRNPRLWTWITDRVLTLAADRIREMTLLILDLSDVHKKYARKKEHLAQVCDGSEGEKNIGYWTLNIIGAEIGSPQIMPLYGQLFSHKAPDFESENIEIREAIGRVSEKTKKPRLDDLAISRRMLSLLGQRTHIPLDQQPHRWSSGPTAAVLGRPTPPFGSNAGLPPPTANRLPADPKVFPLGQHLRKVGVIEQGVGLSRKGQPPLSNFITIGIAGLGGPDLGERGLWAQPKVNGSKAVWSP